MLLSSLYQNLDVLLNNDGTDSYFNMDDFNRIIPDEEINLCRDILEEEKNKPPHRQLLRNKLRSTTNTTNPGLILTNFLEAEGAFITPTSGHIRSVNIIPWNERYEIGDNLLAPPVQENYFMYVYRNSGNDVAQIFPTLAGASYTVFFFAKPTAPFLDYYMLSTGGKSFISASVSLTTLTGTYRDNTTLPHAGTSATSELTLPEEYHQRFMERLIERLSLKDNNQLGVGYALQKDQEDTTKV